MKYPKLPYKRIPAPADDRARHEPGTDAVTPSVSLVIPINLY